MRRFAKLLSLPLLLLTASGQQGCSRAHEHEDSPAAQALAAPPAPTAAVPAVDLPAVVGRSIDEVRRRLGPPQALTADFQGPVAMQTSDSTLAFRRRGLTVLANYDARSRRVLDLLVLGPDEDVLMRRAGLLAGAPAYLLLPVFASDHATRFVGLRVVPRG